MYSVAAASRISGVHPETLRAWERRYDIVQPRRDARGRRVYAPDDVERLRLLRKATDLGHPISRLAALGIDELRRVGGELPPIDGHGEPCHLVARLLDAVERYRSDECDETLGLAATLLEPERLIGNVVIPALRQAGERWRAGELTVAQERLLSGSVRRTLSSLIAAYRRRAPGPGVLLATLPGEPHEIGLMVAALTIADEGLDCIYLGTEIPVDDLITAAAATGAAAVALSCVLDPLPDPTLAAFDDLGRGLPPACELWIGGCGADSLAVTALPAGCIHIDGTSGLRARVDQLRSR